MLFLTPYTRSASTRYDSHRVAAPAAGSSIPSAPPLSTACPQSRRANARRILQTPYALHRSIRCTLPPTTATNPGRYDARRPPRTCRLEDSRNLESLLTVPRDRARTLPVPAPANRLPRIEPRPPSP